MLSSCAKRCRIVPLKQLRAGFYFIFLCVTVAKNHRFDHEYIEVISERNGVEIFLILKITERSKKCSLFFLPFWFRTDIQDI